MTTLPQINQTEWAPAQASPWLVVNKFARVFDGFSLQTSVVSRSETAPPGTCSDGDRYQVATGGTGLWATHDDELAIAVGINATNGWIFVPLEQERTRLYVDDEGQWLERQSGVFVTVAGVGGLDTSGAMDGDTLIWDATNSTFYFGAVPVDLSPYALLTDLTAAINAVIDSSPGALDTLNELAAALGDDANFAATVTTALAGKVSKAGDTMSGDLIVPDEAYDATAWDGNLEVPTKNAVRDKIEAIVAGAGTAASTTEQLTGTDAAKLATPDSVAALWEQGADVASAGTVSLGEGGYFNITGTTTITDIDFGTDKAGRKVWVKFAGALTLTYNASTLILPTGASITTAAGDTACLISEGSDAVRCVAYNRASGAALVASSYTDENARDAIGTALVAGTGIAIVVDDSGDTITVKQGPTTIITDATTARTAALGDAQTYIEFTSASAVAFTVPPNSSVAFPIGTRIVFEQAGAGVVTVTAGAGVTLRSRGSLVASAGQYAVVQIQKKATDTWTIIGDVA